MPAETLGAPAQHPTSVSGAVTRAVEREREAVERGLVASAELKVRVARECLDSILAAASVLVEAFGAGKKLLLCGNGGSAADCQHLAAEFVSRLTLAFERPAIAAIALTTDTSFLTAYANDCGFEGIFARQVEALGSPGDVLLGISTSGKSKNVLAAINQARARGLKTIGLCGAGGMIPGQVDVAICVPSHETQFIQESHLAIEHALAGVVERCLYGNHAAK